MKATEIVLAVFICLACLCALFAGFVFLFFSGFIFAGDIDLTDEQRNSANIIAGIASIFGLVVMLVSLFAMCLSGVLSRRILKLFGSQIDENKIT